MPQQGRAALVGVGALVATVVLWSSFALSSRGSGDTSLTTLDVAVLRFATPLVLLARWLPRTLRAVRSEKRAVLLLLCAGGLPHFLLFAWGAQLTSAGLTGLLVPGTIPLFVTVLLFARRRQPVPPRRLAALGAIVAGVVVSATLLDTRSGLLGVGVLLSAGLIWAVYTLGLQQTGLDPLGVIVLVCLVSTVAAVALAVGGVLPSHLLAGTASAGDIAVFTALQGIGTGLLSTFCYALAVRRLGSGVAAAAGALSPVLTAVVAIPLFGETITTGLGLGLTLIVLGVIAFNTTPTRTRRLPGTVHSAERNNVY